ncbi:unnamed protein product [Ilex paraguariensis]|uniref:Zinc finger family protein n=1 Tax=Ilex paraguariensis TaxID=185542 RepID=A0ABC8S070_9AQUA
MVLGWRRAFCTSIPRPRDREPKEVKEKQEHSNTSTPKLSSKFGFFSNPSTPRIQSQPVSTPSLRCRTTTTTTAPPTATVPSPSVPESPRLQCKTTKSPRLFHRSNPSSPRSPSTFSLLKSTLRLSKSRCGICLQNLKTGQGTAILTAECSHSFHFRCIATHVTKESNLTCPVCSSTWKEMPLLSINHNNQNQKPEEVVEEEKRELTATVNIKTKNESKLSLRTALKVYNDDEPLMLPVTGAGFNPIPESDENEDQENNEEFQGFFVNANDSPIADSIMNYRNVEVRLLPEAAVVSVGRRSETYALVLKVRAPAQLSETSRRAPIDLVTVIDVSGSLNTEKIQMMKRAMRLVVSSLTSSDRLSIVAFSASSKRLLPLRRMTSTGRRSARRIVDAIVALDGTTASANDALKKAAKVLEDRRERNPLARIILLSDGHAERSSTTQPRGSYLVSTTSITHLEIPVHSISFNQFSACQHSQSEDGFAKSVGGLLNVIVQDLRIQLGFVSGSAPAEISGVYSYTGEPVLLGSSSIRVGDFYAGEERELLIELKVPSSAIGAHYLLAVRCSYKDPSTQELFYGKEQPLLVPRPHAVRSSTPSIERLRYSFFSTRAIAESRRLVERGDLSGARHLLASAKALLFQSTSALAVEFVRGLDAELSDIHWRKQNHIEQIQRQRTNDDRQREINYVDEKSEALTPTSAWRAAERLAKVAIMRKSMNRVSDLHGFENARF